MIITREDLESRRDKLQNQLDMLQQQYLTTSGSIADIDHWLAIFDKVEPPLEIQKEPHASNV